MFSAQETVREECKQYSPQLTLCSKFCTVIFVLVDVISVEGNEIPAEIEI